MAASVRTERMRMRTLLIFPGALGDLMLLAPAVAALVRCDVRVEWSVQRTLVDLVRGLSVGDLGPPFDGVAMSSLFTAVPAPALAHWLAGADQVHAWLGREGGASTLARHARALAVGTLRFHSVKRGDGTRHASLAYAAALGIDVPLAAPSLVLASEPPAPLWTVPFPARVVLHPGAGAVDKRWVVAGFTRVADAVRRRGGEVTVLLGPAEEGMAAHWQGSGHRVACGLNLRAAASLLASAPMYVGNDSGISHLAGALGRAGVVLFGPTRPERWQPLGGALAAISFTSRGEDDVAAAILARLAGAFPLP